MQLEINVNSAFETRVPAKKGQQIVITLKKHANSTRVTLLGVHTYKFKSGKFWRKYGWAWCTGEKRYGFGREPLCSAAVMDKIKEICRNQNVMMRVLILSVGYLVSITILIATSAHHVTIVVITVTIKMYFSKCQLIFV